MKTALRALALALLVLTVPACVGFGVTVEKDGKSIGGECHKNLDGTWSCSVHAHLDPGAEHEETP